MWWFLEDVIFQYPCIWPYTYVFAIKQKQTLTKIILNRFQSKIEIMKIEQCYKIVI